MESDTLEQVRRTVERFTRERLVPIEEEVADKDEVPAEILQEMRDKRDPIEAAKAELLKRGVDEEQLKELEKTIRSQVNEAADFAESSPEPEPSELYTDVLVESY